MLPELIKPRVFIFSRRFGAARGPLVSKLKSSFFLAGATGTCGVDVEAWMDIPTTDDVGRPEEDDEANKDAHVFGFGFTGREKRFLLLKCEGGFAFAETTTGGAFEGSLGRVEETTKESDMRHLPVTLITCYAAKQHQMAPVL